MFLEAKLQNYISDWEEEKILRVLQRTFRKMTQGSQTMYVNAATGRPIFLAQGDGAVCPRQPGAGKVGTYRESRLVPTGHNSTFRHETGVIASGDKFTFTVNLDLLPVVISSLSPWIWMVKEQRAY